MRRARIITVRGSFARLRIAMPKKPFPLHGIPPMLRIGGA
jgi:hypothetical protein